MTVQTNPTGFQITDAAAAAQDVTSFNVLVGTVSGGPYTTATASVELSALTLANGVYTGTWNQLTFSPGLSPFVNYFVVVEAVSALGVSGPSPEAEFQLQTAPSAPTAFVLT